MNTGGDNGNGALKSRIAQILEKRHKISVRMYMGISAALLLFVLASVNSWFAFNTVADAQRGVVDRSLPQITGAFAVAEQSRTLVAAAPRLAAAGTLEELENVRTSVASNRQIFESRIDALEAQASDDPVIQRMRDRAGALLTNIEQLDRSVEERFLIADQAGRLQQEIPVLHERLQRLLGPAIDDQYFFTVTGYRDLDSEPVPREQHISEGELARYRRLADLKVNVDNAVQLLDRAFIVGDPQLLEPLLESFESASEAITRNLAALRDPPEPAELMSATERLHELGSGREAAFALRRRELDLAAQERRLLADNRTLEIELGAEAESMVSGARDSARESTDIANEAIDTGQVLLLSVTGVAIIAALLMGSIFIGSLLRRLEGLSSRMRRMAAGDLKTRVDVSGRDEVADMAAALEVFREASLKAQRLDLVERMAQELRDKNEELEQVLEDLKRAQDQIVMREKLAELGELTAGVAHEIQNPLNFVKNFSEVSSELVVELKEVFDEGDGSLSEDDRGLVDEICGDLGSNLERITHHGLRANRIVRDMLKMGRGSGDSQPTDINAPAGRAREACLPQRPRLRHRLQPHDRGRIQSRNEGTERGAAGPGACLPEHGDQRLPRHARSPGPGKRRGRQRCLRAAFEAVDTPDFGRCRGCDSGQRRRHSGRHNREDLQSVLHDQADRPGHRPGTGAVERHRAPARGRNRGRYRTGGIDPDGSAAPALAGG